jgi:tetratricopeptide (TPR) repeat protein
LKSGRIDEAINIILKGVPKDTNYGPVFGVLGDAYCRKRQWPDAYRALRLAVALDPSDELSLDRLKQLEKAAEGNSGTQ